MENGYSLSDIASIVGSNGDGANAWVLIILFALIFGNGGLGLGNRGSYGDYATSASQQEILFGQQFQNIDNKIDRIGNGIADATFALNNSVKDGFGSMAVQFANVNANTTAQTQKILDALAQNKIDSLQAQVSELKTQNMFCGIPRISNYAYGVYPYATNGCGCNGNLI